MHRKENSQIAAFKINPLTPAGAELTGIDLRQPLDGATIEALRDAMAQYRLLIVRDQILTGADQVKVLGVFGNVLDEFRDGSRHSYVSGDSTVVNPGRLLFHSDNHFTQLPLEFLSLFAEDVDERAASTLYIDNVERLTRMPPELVAKVSRAEAMNVSYYFWGQGSDRPSRSVDPDHAEAPRAVHPLIWHHPVSHDPFIYVTELHTHHVLDMELAESDALLSAVRDVVHAPDGIYEHKWRRGDLVIWDNRAVQHARGFVPDSKADSSAPARSIRRVVVGPKDFHDQVQLPASVGAMK